MLVVIVVVSLLLVTVVTVGRGVIDRGRSSETRATMNVVFQAVEQFRSDAPMRAVRQKREPGLTTYVQYTDRYDNYPPDEVEMFTSRGLPGTIGAGTLAPGGAEFVPKPNPPFGSMTFYSDLRDPALRAKEHRDLAAMLLAIRLFSDSASAVLDQVPDRFWSDGAVDENGVPVQFLDRKGDGEGLFSPDDEQIRYVVDAWHQPLLYMSQRDWTGDPNVDPPPAPSSNHPAWNRVSTEWILLNGGAPVLMSYGPNGREQLRQALVDRDPTRTVLGDWMDDQRLSHELNADNVFVNEALAATLKRGLAQQ